MASNINVVAGTRSARAKDAAATDPGEYQRQLDIAKDIARAQFESAFPHLIREDDNRRTITKTLTAEEVDELEKQRLLDLKHERGRRTHALISHPRNAEVYTMVEERSLLTDQMLANVASELKGQLGAKVSNVLTVVKSLRKNMINSLFGCDVHIGICTDANAQVIEFLGEKDYWRRELREKSTIFECLNQKDVVVNALARARTAVRKSLFSREAEGEEEAKPGTAAVTGGEAVVYVPLLSNRGGVGVIEIHGLFSDGITDLKRYERKTNGLKAMINKQDFRFVDNMRLWRRPGNRIRGVAGTSQFDKSNYNLVCGRVREVVFTRNGVPFVGGAHYAVLWEDGFVEEAVSGQDLIKLYACTPQSLGSCSELDVAMAEDLLKLGKIAGELVDAQRTKDALELLKKRLYFPSLGDAETFERTLDIGLTVVRGIREATLVVWDEMELEAVELCTRFVPSVIERSLELSFTEVTAKSVASALPFDPISLGDPSSSVVEWVTMEMKVPESFIWHNNPLRRRFFVNFVRSTGLAKKSAAAETLIFQSVLKTLSDCMEISWQREVRNKHRKELIKQIEGSLFSWRSLAVQDICHNTTQVAATVLPGADVYAGMIMAGGKTMQFLASTAGSEMVGKELHRPQGVSFGVTEDLQTVILAAGDSNKAKYLEAETLVECYYGRKAFKAKIHAVRGHEKYDIQYLEADRKIEAGVDIKRIVPMHTAFRMKMLGGKMTPPYVCVPLRHREKGLGVLGMDGLGSVPRAPYDGQPEPGLKAFLEQLGRILGTTIDLQRKKQSLKAMNLVTKNINSEISHVLEAAFDAICDNLYYVDSIVCGRVVYEIKDILARGGSGVDVVRSWPDTEKADPDALARMETYHPKRSNQKPLQQHGDRTVWLLLKLRGAEKGSSGKIYIISVTQKLMPVFEPDLEYLGVLQKVLKGAVQSLDLKDSAGTTKEGILLDIRNICKDWRKYPRDALFDAVAEKVNQVYLSANIYVGRLGAHGRDSNFFLASSRSKMKGKRLRREKGKARVSLDAMDMSQRIAVTPQMDRTSDLFHFGPPEGFEYPYVAIPLAAHIDGPVGVLCGDACEDPSADGEDVGDVLSFFGTVGMYLSDPVRGYSAQDARDALKKIAYDYPTMRQGMREIKRVVLGVVPYATRVAELCYEPREVRSMAVQDLFGDDSAQLAMQDYVILLKVVQAKLSKNASSIFSGGTPQLHLHWNGQNVYKNNIVRSGKVNSKPVVLHIPRGSVTSKVSLQLVLQGQVQGATKDVAKKTLGLQYLSNTPLFSVEHILDAPLYPYVHAASAQLITKMYAATQIVTMNIKTINIRGLAKADEFGLADPFVIVRWNGVEVTKTSVVRKNLDPSWDGLNIDLKTGSLVPEDCDLSLEVWDQDLMGRGDFLGRVALQGAELVSLFTSGVGGVAAEGVITQDSWINLGRSPKLPLEQQELVQGRIRIQGSAVLASELSQDQMSHELDVVAQLTSGLNDSTAGGSSGEKDEELYYECDIRVCQARDLCLLNTPELPSAFCLVTFNGDEVGRTAVCESKESPEWDEERFSIRAPGGDKLESCTLSVEVQHLGAAGKGEVLGRVELTGRPLVSLVAASAGLKARWLDLLAPMTKANNKQTRQQELELARAAGIGYGSHGQILLAGCPTDDEATQGQAKAGSKVVREVDLAIDPGFLEIGVFTASAGEGSAVPDLPVYPEGGGRLAIAPPVPVTYYTMVYFNDTLVNTSDTRVARDDGGEAVIEWDRSTACVCRVRKPCDKAPEDWTLRVNVYAQPNPVKPKPRKVGEEPPEEPPILVGTATAFGTQAAGLLGQKGCKTQLLSFVALDVAERVDVLAPIKHIQVRCGPEGAADLWDADGRELWLDIMAGVGLPRRPEEVAIEVFSQAPHDYDMLRNARVSPMASVYWNGTLVGETSPVMNSCDPQWEKMRFSLHPPDRAIAQIRDSLTECTLEVRVYDSGPGKPHLSEYQKMLMARAEKHKQEHADQNANIHASVEEKGDSSSFSKDHNDSLHPPRMLIGCVRLAGSQLQTLFSQPKAQQIWYPLQQPYMGESEQASTATTSTALVRSGDTSPPRELAPDVFGYDDDKEAPLGEIKLRGGLAGAIDDFTYRSTIKFSGGRSSTSTANSSEGMGKGMDLSDFGFADGKREDNIYGSGLENEDAAGKSVYENEECVLSIVSATNLAKTDAFANTNPFCIVEYNQKEVFRSNEVVNTLNPTFKHNESFTFRFPLPPAEKKRLLAMGSRQQSRQSRQGSRTDSRASQRAEADEEVELGGLSLQEQAFFGNASGEQELQMSMWNHNPIKGASNEFLGSVTLRGAEIYHTLLSEDARSYHGCIVTRALEQSDYLTPDENEFAQGRLSFCAKVPPRVRPPGPDDSIAPNDNNNDLGLVAAGASSSSSLGSERLVGTGQELPIQVWDNYVLWVKGVKGISNTKMFGSGPDPYVKVYRRSQRDGHAVALEHSTKAQPSTSDAHFSDELVHLHLPHEDEEQRLEADADAAAAAKGSALGQKLARRNSPGSVPSSARSDVSDSTGKAGEIDHFNHHRPDHWGEVYVRIEVWDKSTDDFFGCVELSGAELRKLCSSRDADSFKTNAFPLGHLKESMLAPGSVNAFEAMDSAGGQYVAPPVERVPLSQAMVRGSVLLAGGHSSYYDNHYKPEKEKGHGSAGSKLALTLPSSEDKATTATGDETGKDGDEQSTQESKQEPEEEVDELGEEMLLRIFRASDLSKADGFLGKSDPFCIVNWNGREVGRTAVIPVTLDPQWEDEHFKMNLARPMGKEEAQERGVVVPEGGISLVSKLDIEVWDMDEVGAGDFLGKVTLTGSDLAALLEASSTDNSASAGKDDKECGLVEYPLSPSELLSPRSNMLAVKGSISIAASISSDVRREQMAKRKVKEAKQKEIEENPGLQPSRVEIHLLSAKDLPKVNIKGTADCYVQVHWLEGTEHASSDGVATSTTQVAGNSLAPAFDNEIMNLNKPAGMRVGDCRLRLCAYSKGTLRDEFLGEITLSGAEIVQALPNNKQGSSAFGAGVMSDPEPVTLKFKNSKILGSKYSAAAVKSGASITLTLRQVGVDLVEWVPGTLVPADMKEFELTVMAGSNLPKANTFGLSDPYCVLRWGGREIGKTERIDDCCDPVYEDQTFSFIAPADMGLPTQMKEAAAKQRETKVARKLQRKLAMEGKPASDADVAKLMLDMSNKENAAPPQEMVLTIDCYDWNALNDGVFLGSVELTGEELNDFAAGGRHKVQWFDLADTKRLRKREQELIFKATEGLATGDTADRPRLELMLGPSKNSMVSASKGAEDVESTEVHLEVCAARGLARADTFGSADPFVKVYWNNVAMGTTSVISNNMSPVWEEEKFTFLLPLTLTMEDCLLYLEVWDKDSNGPGSFLGSISLKGNSLSAVAEKSRFHPKWYPLVESDRLPLAIQDLAQGEIEIRLGEASQMAKLSENAKKFQIEIFGAKELPRADGMFGLSDPYAIVKWNHVELGRTEYIPKTLDPVWEEQTTFEFYANPEPSDVEQNHLQVEVWDYDIIGNGKFLGAAVLTGEDLATLFKPNVLADEDRSLWLELKPDPRQPTDRPGDITPKGEVEVRIRVPDEASGSLAASMNLKWESERDLSAGEPTLELTLVEVRDLPVTKMLSSTCNPMAVVTWNDEIVGQSDPGNSCDYSWADSKKGNNGNNCFSLKLPMHVEAANPVLKIELWDTDSFAGAVTKGDYLGCLVVPFRGILRLQHGTFRMPLNPSEKTQYVRGSLTIGLSFSYPYWDSVVSHVPTKMLRRIAVVAANNLPGINDQTPSTKGVIIVNGVVKARTLVSVKTSSPTWVPADFSLVVDIQKPVDVVVVVYHLDLKAKKEVAIGQYAVPFELIVRPPARAFDASLGPPSKAAPKKYKFQVGGNVKILITQDDSATEAMKPWASRIKNPDAALVCHDMCPVHSGKSKQDMLYDGPTLTHEQKLWLGTVCDLTRVQALPTRPEWLVLPLHDPAQRVGYKAVDLLGTRPGQRMALAVERDPSRLNTSDPELLTDIWGAVDECVAQLRRKEIYRVMRSQALSKFSTFLQAAAKEDDYDDAEVSRWIYEAIQTCCPGTNVYTAQVAADFESLRYTMFELGGSTREFTLFQNQGSEWEFAGRHPPRSQLVKSTADLSQGTNKHLTTYRPFPNTNFPRFVVPLRTGDVSLGFFGVENFDIHRGQMQEALTDEAEIKKWFEEIGSLCGDALYTGREKKSLRDIESYTLGWGSTKDGVVVEILRSCMHVVQGCKLMEVWSIDRDNRIQSLAAKAPQSAPLPGRRVTVTSIKIKVMGGRGLKAHVKSLDPLLNADEDDMVEAAVLQAQTEMEDSEAGSLAGNSVSKPLDGVPEGDEDTIADTVADADADDEGTVGSVAEKGDAPKKQLSFLLGLRYDGVEQTQYFKMGENDVRSVVQLDMPFVITYDRTIHVQLYEVAEDLRIKQDWYGKVSFVTFDETALKSSLTAHKNLIGSFDAEVQCEWPEEDAGKKKPTSDVKLSDIKLFTVAIVSARDLRPCDGDTSDPFCEVFWGKQMIGKTKHVEKNLHPTFEAESSQFLIPFTGKQEALVVDMFDMNFLGKGSFLGRVEIPFDLMVTPPPGEFEYPLKMKTGLKANKQQKVGGMLKLEYTLEMKKADQEVNLKEIAETSLGVLEIPRNVWAMQVPAINLTILSATNLAKANLFGGSSDPFVVVFVDGKKASEEPIYKTKEIDDNLNPQWNENFTLNLNVQMMEGSTTAKDFPTIRLEVYDFNNIMKGEFLGMCEISPAIYFGRKSGDFQLQPSPKLAGRKNKLVQGDLSCTFTIQDNMQGTTGNPTDFKYSPSGALLGCPCVEVHVLKCKNLMVAKRMSGRTDPYVTVRWNGKDSGETTTKKGSLDPSWANESFLVNLADAGYVIPDLLIQVWDRDFFTGGECVGEVVVPGDILLHPEVDLAIEAPLRSRRGDKPNKKIRGTLTYKLVPRMVPQRLSFPSVEFIEVKQATSASFQPQDLSIVMDPEAEAKRQVAERLSLPGIVNKARGEMRSYLGSPFERCGLISEMHYGQVMNSTQRFAHTVLKTDAADTLVMPTAKRVVRDKKKEREAAKRAKERARDKDAPPEKAAEVEGDGTVMCIVARYDSGMLPRRDVQFLTRFQDVLMRGLRIATKRTSRAVLREEMDKNLLYMASNKTQSTNDLLVQAVLEMEQGLPGSHVTVYALMPDGKTFAQCSRTRGEPDAASERAGPFLTEASRLVRHGLMLQFFRGQFHIVGWDWLNVSQMGLVGLDSVTASVDLLEEEGYVHNLKELARAEYPEGCMVVPLLGDGEVMLGMAVLDKVDNMPYAAYRIKPILNERRKKKKEATGTTSVGRNKDFVELFGPEDGVVSSLRLAGKSVGVAMLNARVGDCVRRMKKFEITHKTQFKDVLMNTFRLLVIAVPAIRNVSVWGVDFGRAAKLSKGSGDVKEGNFIDRLKALLGLNQDQPGPLELEDTNAGEEEREESDDEGDDQDSDSDGSLNLNFSSKMDSLGDPKSSKSGKSGKSGKSSRSGKSGKSSKSGKSKAITDSSSQKVAAFQAGSYFPEVVCGYFGDENPDNLMSAHIELMEGTIKVVEKKVFGSSEVESKSVRQGARRSSNITHLQVSRKRQDNRKGLKGEKEKDKDKGKDKERKEKKDKKRKKKKRGSTSSASEADSESDMSQSEISSNDDEEEEGEDEETRLAREEHEAKERFILGVPVALQKGGAKVDEEDIDEGTRPKFDVSLFSSLALEGGTNMDIAAVALVHAEALRCVNVLQQKSFRVTSGNLLGSLGSSASKEEGERDKDKDGDKDKERDGDVLQLALEELFGLTAAREHAERKAAEEDEKQKEEEALEAANAAEEKAQRQAERLTRKAIAAGGTEEQDKNGDAEAEDSDKDSDEEDPDEATEDGASAKRATTPIVDVPEVVSVKASLGAMALTEEGEEEDEEDDTDAFPASSEQDNQESPRGPQIHGGIAGTSAARPGEGEFDQRFDEDGKVFMDPNRPKAPLPTSPRGPARPMPAPPSEPAPGQLVSLVPSQPALKKAAPRAVVEQPRLKFFLSVSSNGIGGDDGWGLLGPTMDDLVASVCKELDNTVHRVIRAKKDKAEAVKLKKAKDKEKKTKERQERREARETARKERAEKEKLRALDAERSAKGSPVGGRRDSDSEGSATSGSGKHRRRGSVSRSKTGQRRGSVSRKNSNF